MDDESVGGSLREGGSEWVDESVGGSPDELVDERMVDSVTEASYIRIAWEGGRGRFEGSRLVGADKKRVRLQESILAQ